MPDLDRFELLSNIRAADVRSTDIVELPDRVWIWDDEHANEGMARWRGVLVNNDSRLNWPRWHFVYDALDSTDMGTDYAGDVGAECALEELEEHFVVLRIGAEAPMDRYAPEIRMVALHQFDLVRVQRPVPEPEVQPGSAWVVLEHQGTAVHWDDSTPGLQVFMVDWNEAEDRVEYVEAKDYELDRATFLPEAVRLRLRDQLEAIHERHREQLRR